jgi:hypothetical protein
VNLSQRLLHVMVLDVVDKCTCRDASVLQYERVVPDRGIVDVANRHCQNVHREHEGIRGRHGVLSIDALGTDERQIDLHGLQMKQLEVDILAGLFLLRLWDVKGVIPKLAFGFLGPGSSRNLGEVDQREDEIFVNLERHLLEQETEVLDVQHTVRVILDLGDARLENRMRLHLLTSLRNHTGVEDDREDAAVQLIVDLDPLDLHIDHLVERRVRVLQFEVAQGDIYQFAQVTVNERDSNASKTELRLKSDISVLVLDFEPGRR